MAREKYAQLFKTFEEEQIMARTASVLFWHKSMSFGLRKAS